MKVKLLKEIELRGIICPVGTMVEVKAVSAKRLIETNSAVEASTPSHTQPLRAKKKTKNGTRR